MPTLYSSFLAIPEVPQTHGTELDGTTGRGLFRIAFPALLQSIFCKADAVTDWTISILVPDPANPGTTNEFVWVASSVPTANFVVTDSIVLPAGAYVKIVTSVGTNPLAQIVYNMLQEEH